MVFNGENYFGGTNMKFTKMHGTGNDFIVINDLDLKCLNQESEIAKKMCHRRFGVGADGLILIRPSEVADIKMLIVNSDGSIPNMCGNAIRCFGRYVYDKKIVSKNIFEVETGDGIKVLELSIKDNGDVENIKVNMGKSSFDGKSIPLDNMDKLIDGRIEINNKVYNVTTLLMGVPHTIIFDNTNEFEVEEGKYIEKYPLFKEGTNVNFVKVVDKENIEVRTWERGAGATYSCGTGSCASVIASNLFKYVDKKVNVKVPGGCLIIEIIDDMVYMSGSAEFICEGTSY